MDKPLFERDLEQVAAQRIASRAAIDEFGGTPIETQVAFVRELVENPEENLIFQANPKDYLVQHGVVLDPDVVSWIVRSTLFDATVAPGSEEALGANTTAMIFDLRRSLQPGTSANVVAAAAVVAAVAAVVTMVVTLVRVSRDADRLILIQPEDYRLPGGQIFRNSDPVINSQTFRQRSAQFTKWTI